MKITPVTGPGVVQGAVEIPRSPDKIERAKAIAAGKEPTPVETGDTQANKVQANITKIKMKTNVSPDRATDTTNVVEAPVDTTTVVQTPENLSSEAQPPEETRPLSPQFAALAKAKRALQVKERELAQREEALKTQAPAGQEDYKAKLKANPLSVLQEAGVTYDQLTEAILANQSGNLPEIQNLKTEIKTLKDEFTGLLSARDQQAEQQVLAELRRDAQALTAEGEKYEAIREAKAQRHVVELIHRTWKATGEIMDVGEAADLVENQLIDEAIPFVKIKKVQSRLQPQQVEPAAQIPANPNVKVMRTLTNRDIVSPIMDRRSRAIAAMNGTLKKG